MIQKEIYQEDYYRKPLESMISLTDSASLILAQLGTTLQSYDSQMENSRWISHSSRRKRTGSRSF